MRKFGTIIWLPYLNISLYPCRFQMLMANIGRVVYPTYTIERQTPVFQDRTALVRSGQQFVLFLTHSSPDKLSFLAHLAHSAKVSFWDRAVSVVCRRPSCVNNLLKHLLQFYQVCSNNDPRAKNGRPRAYKFYIKLYRKTLKNLLL